MSNGKIKKKKKSLDEQKSNTWRNSLFQKRPENFLLFLASIFSKQGCFVWDLTNKKYIDMSLMGVGTNVLGRK